MLTSLALLVATSSVAQVSVPRLSPRASVSQTVGTTEIRIDYHRPAVKGRTIWGGLVPYGEVWRLGANNATTLTIGDPVTIAGHEVPAGTYGLFAIPDRGAWALAINEVADQWGAFDYDASKDLFRFEAATRPAPFAEWMGFTLTPVGADGVDVEMRWQHLAVSFPIEVAVTHLTWKGLDAALAESPDEARLLTRAARYSVQTGERLEQGLAYVERALTSNRSNWTLELKAEIMWRLGREAEAIATMEEALAAAEGNAPDEFFRTRGAILDGWQRRAASAASE